MSRESDVTNVTSVSAIDEAIAQKGEKMQKQKTDTRWVRYLTYDPETEETRFAVSKAAGLNFPPLVTAEIIESALRNAVALLGDDAR